MLLNSYQSPFGRKELDGNEWNVKNIFSICLTFPYLTTNFFININSQEKDKLSTALTRNV